MEKNIELMTMKELREAFKEKMEKIGLGGHKRLIERADREDMIYALTTENLNPAKFLWDLTTD